MQQEKHQQVKNDDKSAKDLHSLETGSTVHVQLVQNVRKWVPGTITEKISDRSYKVKTVLGGVNGGDASLSKSGTQTQDRVLRL